MSTDNTTIGTLAPIMNAIAIIRPEDIKIVPGINVRYIMCRCDDGAEPKPFLLDFDKNSVAAIRGVLKHMFGYTKNGTKPELIIELCKFIKFA